MELRAKSLSWRQLEQIAKKLSVQIKRSGYKPDYLVGIAVGGLVPLALISRGLDIRDVAVVSAYSYGKKSRTRRQLKILHLPELNLRGKRVLLVDEIADSGTTLLRIAQLLRSRTSPRELRTATLVVRKEHCRSRPDFSALETDAWVVFPWDS